MATNTIMAKVNGNWTEIQESDVRRMVSNAGGDVKVASTPEEAAFLLQDDGDLELVEYAAAFTGFVGFAVVAGVLIAFYGSALHLAWKIVIPIGSGIVGAALVALPTAAICEHYKARRQAQRDAAKREAERVNGVARDGLLDTVRLSLGDGRISLSAPTREVGNIIRNPADALTTIFGKDAEPAPVPEKTPVPANPIDTLVEQMRLDREAQSQFMDQLMSRMPAAATPFGAPPETVEESDEEPEAAPIDVVRAVEALIAQLGQQATKQEAALNRLSKGQAELMDAAAGWFGGK